MSQILGIVTKDFALVASDSNIADERGEQIATKNKLFVGDGFIITSAGVSFGLHIIGGLMERAKSFGIKSKEDITNYLTTFGNGHYETFKRHYGKDLNSSLLRLYFLFAALDEKNEVSLGFVGAEGDEPLRAVPIGNVITAPRRIVLEMNLIKMVNKTVLELGDYVINYLSKLSQKDGSLKPPFNIAVLEQSGKVRLI